MPYDCRSSQHQLLSPADKDILGNESIRFTARGIHHSRGRTYLNWEEESDATDANVDSPGRAWLKFGWYCTRVEVEDDRERSWPGGGRGDGTRSSTEDAIDGIGPKSGILAVRPVGSMDSVRYWDVKVDVVLGADNIQIQEQLDVGGMKELTNVGITNS